MYFIIASDNRQIHRSVYLYGDQLVWLVTVVTCVSEESQACNILALYRMLRGIGCPLTCN